MLEPLLPRSSLQEAKRIVEAAEVDIQRLDAAIELIYNQSHDLGKIEAAEEKLQRYQTALAHRDETAQLIRDRFPGILEEYLALIESIMKSNSEVDRVNLDLPEGKGPLERPEGTARGFPNSGNYGVRASVETFRIAQSILPSATDPKAMSWPLFLHYNLRVVQAGKGISQQNITQRWIACRK